MEVAGEMIESSYESNSRVKPSVEEATAFKPRIGQPIHLEGKCLNTSLSALDVTLSEGSQYTNQLHINHPQVTHLHVIHPRINHPHPHVNHPHPHLHVTHPHPHPHVTHPHIDHPHTNPLTTPILLLAELITLTSIIITTTSISILITTTIITTTLAMPTTITTTPSAEVISTMALQTPLSPPDTNTATHVHSLLIDDPQNKETSSPSIPIAAPPSNTLTKARIEALRARARMMNYQLQPTLQGPKTPYPTPHSSPSKPRPSLHSNEMTSNTSPSTNPSHNSSLSYSQESHSSEELNTDIILARLRFNRQNLRNRIFLYNSLFSGTAADDVIATLGVYVEKKTVPDILIATNILEQLLKETEWLENESLGGDPAHLLAFKLAENERMKVEVEALRKLIDSYAEVQEELHSKLGIIMSPVELPVHFEQYDGDDEEDYDESEDNIESSEDGHHEQSSELGHDEDRSSQSSHEEPKKDTRAETSHVDAAVQTDVSITTPPTKLIVNPMPPVMPMPLVMPTEQTPLLQQEPAQVHTRHLQKAIPYIAGLAIGILIGVSAANLYSKE
ncbi:hypothetical protein TWF481_005302 [Arthrobotrys musiformis]|uniref:Uncharacterized protein n=1 Tax=Arthrobotrys musiformis TaxID=47236 RepID=A0AAV9WF33_9PEZI